MAHLHRLIRWLLLILAGGVSIAAHALVPLTYTYSLQSGSYGPYSAGSASAVCSPFFADYTAAMAALNRTITAQEFRPNQGQYGDCYIKNSAGGSTSPDVTRNSGQCPPNSIPAGSECMCVEGYNEVDGSCVPPLTCPEGQVLVNGVCVLVPCPEGQERIGGECVPKCPPTYKRINGVCTPSGCPTAGTGAGGYTFAGESTQYICEPFNFTLCMVRVPATVTVTYGDPPQTWGSGEGKYTGGSCTAGSGSGTPGSSGGDPGTGGGGDPGDGGGGDPGDGGGGDPGDGDGGSGGTPGGGGSSGGNETPGGCAGTGCGGGSSIGGGPISGGGFPPPGPVTENGDGTCPTGTSRINGACINDPVDPGEEGDCPTGSVLVVDKCVYSAPGPDAGGGEGGDGDGEGGESAFGGACSSGFACEGDAIQCAIAREQHHRNCTLFWDTSSAEAQLYEQRKGRMGDMTQVLDGNTEIAFGASSIDTSNAIGGSASCMPNLQVTVMGASLSLPFSVLCPYLGALGNVLMAVSMLLAARIFMRG